MNGLDGLELLNVFISHINLQTWSGPLAMIMMEHDAMISAVQAAEH